MDQWNNDPQNDFNNQQQQQFCEDKHSDCAENKMYCHGKNSEWIYKNCQGTCGKCYGGQHIIIIYNYNIITYI